jgi:hypothetical protein
MIKLVRAVGVAMLGALAFAGAALAEISEPGPYYSLPSWDQQFPASTRWVILSNWGTPPNAAVLDRETGLVWQQTPYTDTDDWYGALTDCQLLSTTGGRLGWRLPALEELLTLVDPNTGYLFAGAPFPSLPPPPGTGPSFWTATTYASVLTTLGAYQVGFPQLGQSPYRYANVYAKNVVAGYWCVRGYQGTQNPQ